ncbi:GNAT family N-acetyltransferase [Chloroflexota bacterium]
MIIAMLSTKQAIREITDNELSNSAKVIRDSFKTVAIEFSLTKGNCPTHPSLTTVHQLRKLKEKGLLLFGLFLGNIQVGFVAIEKAENDLYYMEKLAVLPDYRHKGYGVELAKFVLGCIKNRGGKKLGIGIMNDHTVLKDWYKGLGFKETSTKRFPHLPFTVCFMEIA